MAITAVITEASIAAITAVMVASIGVTDLAGRG
jgi:hypothetical protein